jgi:hypothetical protein
MRIVLGLFLVGHALIHFSYLSPAPPRTAGGPEWPFEMSKSWLVTNVGLGADLVRPIGTVLVAITVLLLLGAGLATLRVVVPHEWWQALVLAGAIASLTTLALFFHPWLLLGVAIDAALLYLVLINGWDPFAAAASHAV